ncbi:DUF982 domain-containing protein [Rhizobiaceae sp. 2RAB30]
MDTKNLPMPIVIFVDRAKTFTLIATATDASDFLFDNWINNDSKQWTDAMSQCAGVGTGKTSIEDASVAFILAVEAAGMRVDPTIAFYGH